MMKRCLLASTAIALLPSAYDNRDAVAATVGGIGELVDADPLLKRAPDSAAMLDYWDQVDCIVEGLKAVRNAGQVYLPKFVDEEQADYDFRLSMTKFTNVYRDTIEGLANKPFEEEITLIEDDKKGKAPEEIIAFCEDVDGSGNNLTMFGAQTFFNGINSAIDWIFVDYPTVDREKIKTQRDAKNAGIRPFWTHVLGRNVLEARVNMIEGNETLVYVRIFEPGDPDHVRVFERVNGVVTWKLYRKVTQPKQGSKSQFELIAGGVVSIGVIPLVPFYTGRRDGRTFKFFPMMRDAADLQIELYQQESGLKYAKTLTAYAMLAANGISPPMEADGKTPKKLRAGPGRILYSKPDGNGNIGSWAFIEPSATSLKFLADDIKETILQLRELGRQPLTAQSGNLTTITTMVAASKARSAIAACALNLKNTLENALVLTAKWQNLSGEYDPEVNVYTEFDSFDDNGKDVEQLGKARDRGDLSRETYLSELKRRKVLSPEFDYEQEEERLLEEIPADLQLEDINPQPANPPTNRTTENA